MSKFLIFVKNKNGFMLFEVILSIAILSFGLVLVLRSFTNSLKAVKVSQNYMRATLLLEEKMNEIERKGAIPAGISRENFSEDNKRFAWELEAIPVKETSDEEEKEKKEGKEEKEEKIKLNEVRLTVSWLEGKKKEMVRITTYLRNEEEEN